MQLLRGLLPPTRPGSPARAGRMSGVAPFAFRHPGFQRSRDATLTTGLAAATQRDRQSHERPLAFGQPSMRVGSGKVIAEARSRYLSTCKVSYPQEPL